MTRLRLGLDSGLVGLDSGLVGLDSGLVGLVTAFTVNKTCSIVLCYVLICRDGQSLS